MQTVVIAVVVLFSTATIAVALGLLVASTQPFDRAFAQQNGAHVTATFSAKATDDLAATSDLDEVEAAAGPFGIATENLKAADAPDDIPGVSFTIVGRDRPVGGQVDAMDLWQGRWAAKPGEIVVKATPGMDQPARDIGARLTDAHGRTFTVVGKAYSLSDTADAWVTPGQMADLKPTETQMLYRFHDHDTSADIAAGLKAVTDRLPEGSLVASQSYLVIKKTVSAGPGKYLPFLMVFGILGVLVAVFVVVNVVSGAVVS
ncbi:MAG TPA: ABC transporter permease, partial [Stackebrandtia sp.]|nr:ABC transporter permease [Stackebrandtia sp.]